MLNKCTGEKTTVQTAEDGSFDFCLDRDCDFEIVASKENFMATETMFSTINNTSDAVAKEIINGEIAATKPPIELMPQQVSAIWHKRQDGDKGLSWLRAHFKQIVSQKVEQETALVINSLCKNNPSMCNQGQT